MPVRLKSVRTIFIFNRPSRNEWLSSWSSITLSLPSRENFINVARIIERVGLGKHSDTQKKTHVYLESLFAKLLSRGGGTLIAGFPTKSCENGEGWRRELLFARLFLRFFLYLFFFSFCCVPLTIEYSLRTGFALSLPFWAIYVHTSVWTDGTFFHELFFCLIVFIFCLLFINHSL